VSEQMDRGLRREERKGNSDGIVRDILMRWMNEEKRRGRMQ